MALGKGAKIGLVVGVILLALLLLWYFFSSPSSDWTETRGGDIPGDQYDIEKRPMGTVDADKAYAKQIGAQSFVRNPGGNYTFFKNAKGPVTTNPSGNYTLYIAK